MKRLYENLAKKHLEAFKQMVFFAGPRQVGKTTIAKKLLKERTGCYLNWDIPEDRALLLGPYKHIIDRLGPRTLGKEKPLVVFDEIHKYKDWKNQIKGFFDAYKDQCALLVAGSAKLDIYHKGGDSLMGRYFPYTVHPLSLREVHTADLPKELIQPPLTVDDKIYQDLYTYGGFPDPYLQKSEAFSNQWKRTRSHQLFREDIRNLSNVQDLDQMELLAFFLRGQTGQLLNYTSLSKQIRMTDQTVRRWLSILHSLYYCFSIKPWSKNIPRSLLKDPVIYLWDWSEVEKPGARFENFIACHLLKAVSYWEESGEGNFGLYYLRDKEKREVDFLITKNKVPWILVEAKSSKDNTLSPSLKFFQDKTKAPYAFQVVHNMDYVEASCFEEEGTPLIVPAKTFLSQFV